MRMTMLASAAALLLVGCGEAAEENVQAPTNATAETAARAPAVTVPAAPQPAAAWTLTGEGLGPLRIGMTLAEVTAAAGADSDPQAVGGAEPERCDQFRPAKAPPGVLVMMEQGRLTRISLIRDAALATDLGLKIGDTPEAVRKVYGADLVVEPHKYVEAPAAYLTHWSRGGRDGAYVEDPAARGIRYEIGREGRVQAIHAGGPSIQYVEGCS